MVRKIEGMASWRVEWEARENINRSFCGRKSRISRYISGGKALVVGDIIILDHNQNEGSAKPNVKQVVVKVKGWVPVQMYNWSRSTVIYILKIVVWLRETSPDGSVCAPPPHVIARSTSPPSLHIYLIFTSKHTLTSRSLPLHKLWRFQNWRSSNKWKSSTKTGSRRKSSLHTRWPYTGIWLTRHRLSCSLWGRSGSIAKCLVIT